MLHEADLQALLAYRPGHKVLSVYLNLARTAASNDENKLQLRQMLREFTDQLPEDTEALERFLEHGYDGSGRSLALFSCAADNYFRAYSLGVGLRSRARAMDHPYVKPLADLIDDFADYAIVLADQQAARFFTFHLGFLEEKPGFAGEAVRHIKRGGGSTGQQMRGGESAAGSNPDELVERNLREAARAASQFLSEHGIRRLILGGNETILTRIREQLPEKWRAAIVDSFPLDMNSGVAQLHEMALQSIADRRQAQDEQLVMTLITAAAKGREGVVRLDDTLEAVNSGRVRTLVAQEGFRAPGYRCASCRYITTQPLAQCPFCGAEFQVIDDAVEHAVQRVLSDNGVVRIVHANTSLEHAGNIGGLLRY